MSTQYSFHNPSAQPYPYPDFVLEAYRELLRQARQTFNFLLISIGAAILVLAVGCILTFIGYPTEGVFMAIAGGGTTGFCNRLAKESQRKLERLIREAKSLPNT